MRAHRLGLVAGLCLAFSLPAGPSHAAPYSSHSQIYSCCTPSATKEAMFREAKESGAAFIRLDINLPTIFAPERYGISGPSEHKGPNPLLPIGEPGDNPLDLLFPPARSASGGEEWIGIDDIARLSRKYQLPVLGILLGSSHPTESCPARIDRQRLCPPADPAEWGAQAGKVAARYRGVIDHFEIWNEPDGRWAFDGEPEDYARLLTASYDAIKAASPSARVVLGGTMSPGAKGAAWLSRVFATGPSLQKFDIGSIHVRGRIKDMLPSMRERTRFLTAAGRAVPMWVTEHGYPSETKWQRDANYRGGGRAQAAYLSESLPALALAGAEQVFVTLRDGGGGQFDSEGILRGQARPGEAFSRKVGWTAVRDAAAQWPVEAFVPELARSKVVARRLRNAVRVTFKGRFLGPVCSGRVRFGIRPVKGPRTVRSAVLKPNCRYARALVLELAEPVRAAKTIRVDQRFLGNARTGPGDAQTLTVRVKR